MNLDKQDIKIIMVEDDDGHARLIEKNLRRSGITNELIHFSNGRTVLDYLRSKTIDTNYHKKVLLLLDLNLPEIDGFEVLQNLQSYDDTKKIPVIIMTTTNNPKEVDRCYELGCSMYINKPVDYQNFSEALVKLSAALEAIEISQSMDSV